MKLAPPPNFEVRFSGKLEPSVHISSYCQSPSQKASVSRHRLQNHPSRFSPKMTPNHALSTALEGSRNRVLAREGDKEGFASEARRSFRVPVFGPDFFPVFGPRRPGHAQTIMPASHANAQMGMGLPQGQSGPPNKWLPLGFPASQECVAGCGTQAERFGLPTPAQIPAQPRLSKGLAFEHSLWGHQAACEQHRTLLQYIQRGRRGQANRLGKCLKLPEPRSRSLVPLKVHDKLCESPNCLPNGSETGHVDPNLV